MDDDILEVGDDGVFEITSTKPVKQTVVAQPNYEDVKFEDEEDGTENREDLLNNINPGEYKIYKSNGFVYILLKLQDNDTVQKVSLADHELLVETANNKFVVSLKSIDAVNPKSGTCTAWKDYVTIKYALQ